MDAITIGPLSLSTQTLATLAAVLLATAVGNAVARRRGLHVEGKMWAIILAALLAARLAYVVRFRDAYLDDPLGILNVRDGGWTAWAGVATALGALAWMNWRRPAERAPLLAGGAAAALVGVAAALLLALPAKPVALPALELAALDGGKVPLHSLRGKPLVINLWASWCPPCRREMPVLRDAQARHPDVTFVFVNQGEAPAVVGRYLDAERIALKNVLLDPRSELPAAIGTHALPVTLFFDRQGRLVERRLGELSAASLAQRLLAISDER